MTLCNAVRHFCSSLNAKAKPKAVKEPASPSLSLNKIEDLMIKLSNIWTVLKLTYN